MKPKDQNYSKSRRLKNQIKAVVTNPYNVIVLNRDCDAELT